MNASLSKVAIVYVLSSVGLFVAGHTLSLLIRKFLNIVITILTKHLAHPLTPVIKHYHSSCGINISDVAVTKVKFK